jgi:hypothetical protein
MNAEKDLKRGGPPRFKQIAAYAAKFVAKNKNFAGEYYRGDLRMQN